MKNQTNVQKAGRIGVDYKEYIEYMINRGYSRDHLYIDETYTDIVTMLSLEKGAAGTAIDIRCPPSYKLIIIGTSQIEEYRADITGFLTVRLANTENMEIDPDVRIRIFKEKTSLAITLIDTMFYKDLSATEYTKTHNNNGDSKTRPLEEYYVFDKGIEMNGGEHLKIGLLSNLDIDASKTRLLLGIDLWEQE